MELSKKEQLKFINDYKNKSKKADEDCKELWSWLVRARANYRCEYPRCTKGKWNDDKLDPHHIYSKGAFKHMRFDLDNGICLCFLHHRAGAGQESAHSDIFFKDKITGKMSGYKAVRTEELLEKLNRKAQVVYKVDEVMERVYLIQEAKKYKGALPEKIIKKYDI